MTTVLIIDDDAKLTSVVVDWLQNEGYEVDSCNSGTAGFEKLQKQSYDLIVLDRSMPGMDGFELCKRYRAQGGRARILMLTGSDSIAAKEQGLDAGADDYLTKPFHPKELSARLRALLRRSLEVSATVFRIGTITLDSGARKVLRNEREISLLPREFDLLEFLMKHPNQVFSHETLLDKVWSKHSEVAADTVKVHINKLRNKLDLADQTSIIRTVHRRGYMLQDPEQ